MNDFNENNNDIMDEEEKNWNWLWSKRKLNDAVEHENFNTGTDVQTKFEPLVREVVQNSIDAGGNTPDKPVHIKFEFGRNKDVSEGKRYFKKLFDSLSKFRFASDFAKINFADTNYLKIQDFVYKGGMDFVGIQDFLTKYGKLIGSKKKAGNNLGGAGRGRITIAEASKFKTLLLRSKYKENEKPIISGFSLLNPVEYNKYGRTNSAKLCTNKPDEEENYLFDFQNNFVEEFEYNFGIEDNYEELETGLSLIIPQPHADINEVNIINCLIINYSVAIMKGILKPEVGGKVLEPNKLKSIYSGDKDKKEVNDTLNLIQDACQIEESDREIIKIPTGEESLRIKDLDKEYKKSLGNNIEEKLNNRGKWFGKVEFILIKGKIRKQVSFNINISRNDNRESSSSLLFRSGMLIPEGFNRKKYTPSKVKGLSVIIDVQDPLINKYLLNCESKAHRSFDTNETIKHSLKENGFDSKLKELFLIAGSAKDIVELISGADDQAGHLDMFANIWGITLKKSDKRRKKPRPLPGGGRDIVPRIKPTPKSCIYSNTENGLQFCENPENSDFMEEISIGFAYTNDDASKLKHYDPLDFQLDKDIKIKANGVNYQVVNEKSNCTLHLTSFQPNWEVSLDGFDENREVIHSIKKTIRSEKDAEI
jgi:hypothetical protein